MKSAPKRGDGALVKEEAPRVAPGGPKENFSTRRHSAPSTPVQEKPRRTPTPEDTIVALRRRVEITSLLRDRHGGPCLTSDAEAWFDEVAIQLAVICTDQGLPVVAGEWVDTHTPNLPPAYVEATLAQVRRVRQQFTSADIGRRLKLLAAEKDRLGITHIAASDLTPQQVARRKRTKDAARKRRARLEQGATPRHKSLARTRPWEAMGISESTWKRRRRRGEL